MAVSRRWLLSRGAALAALLIGGCTDDKRDDVAPASTSDGELSADNGGAFGGVVEVGALDAVRKQIVADAGALYVPAGRFWLVDSPDGDLLALYQKCTH